MTDQELDDTALFKFGWRCGFAVGFAVGLSLSAIVLLYFNFA